MVSTRTSCSSSLYARRSLYVLDAEIKRIENIEAAEKALRQAEINERVALRSTVLHALNAPFYQMDLAGMAEADFQAHLAVARAKFEEAQAIQAEKDAYAGL